MPVDLDRGVDGNHNDLTPVVGALVGGAEVAPDPGAQGHHLDEADLVEAVVEEVALLNVFRRADLHSVGQQVG